MPWLCASSGSLRIARNAFPALLSSQKNSIGCGKAKHDKIDHPVLLQILTGQAGKSSETMQPEGAAGHEVHEF
jgi:hypothetical protein